MPSTAEHWFKGFSFVDPAVLLADTTLTKFFVESGRPTIAGIKTASRANTSIFFKKYSIDFTQQPLGDGSFSICLKCVHRDSSKAYAVKVMTKSSKSEEEVEMLIKSQGHPNIVHLQDVQSDSWYTYVVLELLKGRELFHDISKDTMFSEKRAASIMRQLASAVSHLHSLGIVHRDLKPENIVFALSDCNYRVKIVDFGFASKLKRQPGEESARETCFTLNCAAPEVIDQFFGEQQKPLPAYNLRRSQNPSSQFLSFKSSKYQNTNQNSNEESCDLWSLGVILYAMLCGEMPFHYIEGDSSDLNIMRRIKEAKYCLSGPQWQNISSQARSLVIGLLKVNPKRRLNTSQVLNHCWLEKSVVRYRSHSVTQNPQWYLENTEPTESLREIEDVVQFELLDTQASRLAQRRKRSRSTEVLSCLPSSSHSSGDHSIVDLSAVSTDHRVLQDSSNYYRSTPETPKFIERIIYPSVLPASPTRQSTSRNLPVQEIPQFNYECLGSPTYDPSTDTSSYSNLPRIEQNVSSEPIMTRSRKRRQEIENSGTADSSRASKRPKKPRRGKNILTITLE